MHELRDRVAVVTGAASGIGLGIAAAFVVGRIVVDAIRNDRMYVFTHPECIPDVVSRFPRITAH